MIIFHGVRSGYQECQYPLKFNHLTCTKNRCHVNSPIRDNKESFDSVVKKVLVTFTSTKEEWKSSVTPARQTIRMI